MSRKDKEKKFCRLVAVDKIKPGPAYAQVFDVKPRSASTLARRLLQKVDIQSEIERLENKSEKVQEAVALWSKAERMEKLQEWAAASAEAGRVNDAVRCVDLLNKMDGAYAPEKVEVSSDESWRAAILRRSGAEPFVRPRSAKERQG